MLVQMSRLLRAAIATSAKCRYSAACTPSEGHTRAVTRDLPWAAIREAAARLNERATGTTLEVKAARRRSLRRWRVVEGLAVVDNWTDVFEPVRERRPFMSSWREVQPLEEAASKVGWFLRERPDIGKR